MFLTKQAYKENSPEKHPLNTIDHAAIERLCCCSLQLTIFNSLSLSTKSAAINFYEFVFGYLIIKLVQLKEYKNSFVKTIRHFFTKSNS